ncbi:hypothetical protein GZ77_15210 [Endozoicomonas montiporae]|uniref:Major facilitator superfamily (MFS) profile domain-containing protein n=2 Tax=Endozoicomonas montiporae TaxID=1027273 RepID=A0A081N5D0_9GAMM|nr:MFS transporter [Endozoicomonas montiporae]AMO57465.1 major facilitator superfamily protein [Endozoicomonas montiporae CL-33]KEQ13653.1 hypothetical protein GZ77_15210 [Endozoicomonas montiporae]
MKFRFMEPFYLAAIAYGFVLEGINIMLIPQLLAQQVEGGEYYSGFILGMQAAGALLGPLWGMLCEKSGRHRMLLTGVLLLASISQAALLLASELWHWIALVSVLSVSIPASLTCLMCCIFHRHPAIEWDQRQNNLLMVQAVAAVGGLAIASYFPGERAAEGMLLGALIMFISALAALFTTPGHQAFQTVQKETPSASSERNLRGSLPLVFWVVMLAWVLVNTANNLFFYSYSQAMDIIFDIGQSVSPLIIGGASALALLVYPKIGDICRRVNAFHLLHTAFIVRISSVTGLLLAALYLPTGTQQLLLAVSFLMCLYRLSWNAMFTGASVLLAKLGHNNRMMDPINWTGS